MRRSSGIRRAKRVIGQAIETLEARCLLSTTLFSTDFESGNGGFALSPASPNLWHVSNLASQSGVASMYYGQEVGQNYDTGATNTGAIVSPTINLSGHAAASLRFRYYCYTDNVEDIAEVDITTNGGTTWTRLAANEDGTLTDAPQWNLYTTSLNSYVGNNVQLKFLFNTVDNIGNDYTGWFVDDVVVADPGSDPAPEITAITPAYGSTISTSSTTIAVTFSEAVQGVDATDLVLGGVAAGPGTAQVTGVTAAGGNTYNFTVTGLTSGVLSASIAQPGNATPIKDLTNQIALPAIQKFIVLLPDRFEGGGNGNNTFATATNLNRIGGVLPVNNLTLDSATDVDYFKFTPDGTGTTTVSISCPWVLADVDLYVYDGSQNLVGSSATFADSESVSFTGTMGQTYYIKAISPVGDTTYDYDMSITAPAVAPTVTGVYVKGSTTWAANFLNYLQTSGQGDSVLGYAIPTGSAQTKTLPWTNIDQISVKFSEDVAITQGDLAMAGVNTSLYNIAGTTFSYNSTTFVATWQFGSALAVDKVNLALNADGTGPVADRAGIRLDGEFTTGVSNFPSGNGTAGGNFVLRFSILPGDANQNNSVSATDVTLVRNAQFHLPGDGVYSIFKDINASATISATDITLIRNRQFTPWPAAEPSVPVFA